MNALTLKIIALTAMIIDHMGATFPETFGPGFRVVGRLAFPIYVFLIAEGFFHTKNSAKFLLRLFLFAVISEPFFDMALKGVGFADVNFFAGTNIFYTLFLGGAAIVAYQYLRKVGFAIVAIVSILLCMGLAQMLSSDYGAYGVLFIFVMYWLRHYKLAAFALLCLWPYVELMRAAYEFGFAIAPIQYWLMIPATLLTVVPVALYNGRRGPGGPFVKWFFYAAYPVHLAVLAGFRI